MRSNSIPMALLLLAGTITICASGCAEGMLWRTGHMAPWVRKTWEAEERIATTLFTRKQQMGEAVDAAASGPESEKNRMAEQLHEVIFRDPVVLLRIHAVDLLAKLDCEKSVTALRAASKDRNSDIRIAAVKSLANLPEPQVIPILQDVIGSDTNGDVRLAATRAVGSFSGAQTLSALAIAVEDKDPALQVAAIESLEKVTGQDFGPDVFAWKSYLNNQQIDFEKPSNVAQRTEQLELPSNLHR